MIRDRRTDKAAVRRLYKTYERAHVRSRALARGIGEELKTSISPDEILNLLDFAATDLVPACKAEAAAYKSWEKARPKRDRSVVVRTHRRNPKSRKRRAGGNA